MEFTNKLVSFIDLVGCTASYEQGGFPCLESIDGVINDGGNGWAYGGLVGSSQDNILGSTPLAWVIFEVAEPTMIYSVQIISGAGRGDHKILIFKIEMNIGGQWIIPNDLVVQEAPEATIESDGFINLDSAITDLTLIFNPVVNVASIRLTVTGHLFFLCKKNTYVP